jgi:hypothetical protein
MSIYRTSLLWPTADAQGVSPNFSALYQLERAGTLDEAELAGFHEQESWFNRNLSAVGQLGVGDRRRVNAVGENPDRQLVRGGLIGILRSRRSRRSTASEDLADGVDVERRARKRGLRRRATIPV